MSDLDGNPMQKLHPLDVDVPSYNFDVHKIVDFSSSMVVSMVHMR